MIARIVKKFSNEIVFHRHICIYKVLGKMHYTPYTLRGSHINHLYFVFSQFCIQTLGMCQIEPYVKFPSKIPLSDSRVISFYFSFISLLFLLLFPFFPQPLRTPNIAHLKSIGKTKLTTMTSKPQHSKFMKLTQQKTTCHHKRQRSLSLSLSLSQSGTRHLLNNTKNKAIPRSQDKLQR